MPRRLRHRPPVAPAFVPAAVLVVTAAGTVLVLDLVDGPARALALLDLARTAALALTGVALRRRLCREDPARPAWRALGLGLLVLAAGSAVDVATRLLTGAPGPVPALTVALLVAAPLVQLGQLRWNRIRSDVVGAAHRLDSLGAVLSTTALLVLLHEVLPGPAAAGGVALQLGLLGVGVLVVLVGTSLRIAFAHGCSRDVRLWLVVVPVAVVAAAQTAVLLTPSAAGWAPTTGWLLLCLAAGVASRLPRPPTQAPTTGPHDVEVAVFVALGSAVAVLAVDGVVGDRASLLWALAAVLVLSVRVARLVGGLTRLARHRVDATRDDLTGLVTRGALRARTDRVLAGAGGAPVSLLVLDLDHFQTVNDRFSHRTGDLVLAALSRRLREAAPVTGVLARMGGDEFAVLLPAGVEEARAVAERFLAVCRAGVDVDTRHLDLWASVGIAVSGGREPVVSGDELTRRADVAMWTAKENGGGVSVYDDDVARAGRGRALLAEELTAVLGPDAPVAGRGQFEVRYQPQVSLADDEVVGVEALVRWHHPELGLLEPHAFLDVVEERGLMPSLTAHVVRTATADLRAWRRAHLRLRLSINASASCLTGPLLLGLLDEVVDAGTDPRQLVLEVTETTLMAEPERALAVCHALTARGVGLSIDDYGTGFSSLAYLADLPVTELKVDRSFTRRVSTDPRIAAIVAGTVELAHHLGLRAVAEGVEDRRTLSRLRTLGCDETQGFLHSPALPARDLPGWVQARDRTATVPAPAHRP